MAILRTGVCGAAEDRAMRSVVPARLTCDAVIDGWRPMSRSEYTTHIRLLRALRAAGRWHALRVMEFSEEESRVWVACARAGLLQDDAPRTPPGPSEPFRWLHIELSDYGRLYLSQRETHT